MNAIELLESQHREVEALFKEVKKNENNPKVQKEIFGTIAEKLELHAKLEEKIFYPDGEEVDEDMTLEAYEEHALVKLMLKKIAKTKPSDEMLMARLTVLKELVEHHVEEEESEYFPECEKKWGKEKLEEMGEEMMALVEKSEKPAQGSRKRAARRA